MTFCTRFTRILFNCCSAHCSTGLYVITTTLSHPQIKMMLCFVKSFYHFLHNDLTLGQTDSSLLTYLCHFLVALLTCNHTPCPLPSRLNILPTTVTSLALTHRPATDSCVMRQRHSRSTVT